jgi:TPR repeat protein
MLGMNRACALILVFGLVGASLPAMAQSPENRNISDDALIAKGDAYASGSRGRVNYEEAYEAYLMAADRGVSDGYLKAARLKETGRLVSDDPAQDQLDASFLYASGAELGCLVCMREAARMLETAPLGVEQDMVGALNWYQRAYNASPTKSDGEFSHIARVSSFAYYAAMEKANLDDHQGAFRDFKALCDLKGPAACFQYGRHLGAENSPYGRNLPASLVPMQFACDHQLPGACRGYAFFVGFNGPSAGATHGRRAEQFFKSECDRAVNPDYSACFRVAWFNYYGGFGLTNWNTMKAYAAKGCLQGRLTQACTIHNYVVNRETPQTMTYSYSPGASSRGGWGRSVDNAIGGIFTALLSGSSSYASSGSVGSSSRYSPPSQSSSNNVANWQADRDWNQARRATANIGSAYSSSCRPGNRYC